MKLHQSFSLTILACAVAALSACGGGGGGDAAPYEAIASISPPDSTATGLLAAPTKVIDFTTGSGQLTQIEKFIKDLNGSLAVAPLGKAVAALASADDDGNGPVAGGQYLSCAAPGTLTISGSTYNFSGCVVDGNQVDGQATLIGSTTSQYTLSFDGISVTLAGASPIAIKGRADCTVTVGAMPKCVVELGPITPLSTETYRFGWNAAYAAGTANGTHGCGCTETWLVTLNSFTATGGSALIQASNGSALIRRDSANVWDAELTPTGGQTIIIPNITTN
jgi:hypothetical protein